MDLRRARRLLLYASTAGLLIRLAFGFGYWNGKPLTHDEQEYLELARNIGGGRGFTYAPSFDAGTGQTFGRAPGYPLFLAGVIAGDPGPWSRTPGRIKLAQSLVGAAAVWIIGLIALRTGGPRAGVAAASIAAVYPPLVVLPAYVLSETLYSTVALGSVLALQSAVDNPTSRADHGLAAVAGALTGAAALVRPAMLFFLPLAALWLVVRKRHAAAAVLCLAALLVIVPWTVRNVRVHNRLVLIASEGGVTFWTGNHPLARGEGDLAANPPIKLAELELRRLHAGLSAEELEPVYYRDAVTYIRQHPLWWASLIARKAFYLVVPAGPSYALHSTKYRIASAGPYLLLLPFALAGGRRLRRGCRPPAALFLLGGSAVLVCLIFFPQERFRIPVIDPTLIVCASGLAGRARP